MLGVGIIGMGAMGAAIGGRLRQAGFAVCTDLAGRSKASQDRATSHNIEIVSFQDLLASSSLVLSIVPPGQASATASKVRATLSSVGHKEDLVFVDCNAASPESKRNSASLFSGSNVEFVDGAIIGEPPTDTFNPQFYASSKSQAALDQFLRLSANGHGLKIKVLEGQDVGAASALKSSYSGITKGSIALLSAMVIAAQKNGALDALFEELQASRPAEFAKIKSLHRVLTPRAYRFGPEMAGIGEFADSTEAGDLYRGMAKFYEHLAEDQRHDDGDWKLLEQISQRAAEGSPDDGSRW